MTQTTIPNEIAAALIADKCRSNEDFMRRMQVNGTEALASLTAASASDIKADIRTVQNTPNRVHIVLPDYSSQKDIAMRSQEMMSDEDMAQIAGGEIVSIIAAIVTVSLVGTIVVGGSIALGIHYSNEAKARAAAEARAAGGSAGSDL